MCLLSSPMKAWRGRVCACSVRLCPRPCLHKSRVALSNNAVLCHCVHLRHRRPITHFWGQFWPSWVSLQVNITCLRRKPYGSMCPGAGLAQDTLCQVHGFELTLCMSHVFSAEQPSCAGARAAVERDMHLFEALTLLQMETVNVTDSHWHADKDFQTWFNDVSQACIPVSHAFYNQVQSPALKRSLQAVKCLDVTVITDGMLLQGGFLARLGDTEVGVTVIMQQLFHRWLRLLDDADPNRRPLNVRANGRETITSGASSQLSTSRDRPDTIFQDRSTMAVIGLGEEKLASLAGDECRRQLQRYSGQMTKARHGSAGFRMAYAAADHNIEFLKLPTGARSWLGTFALVKYHHKSFCRAS